MAKDSSLKKVSIDPEAVTDPSFRAETHVRYPTPKLPYRHGYGYSTITREEYLRWEQGLDEDEARNDD